MPSHKNEIVEKPKSKTPKKKATNKKSSQTRKLMKVNCNPMSSISCMNVIVYDNTQFIDTRIF